MTAMQLQVTAHESAIGCRAIQPLATRLSVASDMIVIEVVPLVLLNTLVYSQFNLCS